MEMKFIYVVSKSKQERLYICTIMYNAPNSEGMLTSTKPKRSFNQNLTNWHEVEEPSCQF